jgi:hypothetical protein
LLSESPPSGKEQSQIFVGEGYAPVDWSMSLQGDIEGTAYQFAVYLASLSKTTYQLDIILDHTGKQSVLATTNVEVEGDKFKLYLVPVNGTDPDAVTDDKLIFRMSHITGENGAAAISAETASYIAISTQPLSGQVFAPSQPSIPFIGDMKGNEAAGDGTISFKVSADGSSIGEVSLAATGEDFKTSKCSGGSLTNTTFGGVVSYSGSFPIIEGKIDVSLGEGTELKGQFTSPTEASGTVHFTQEDFPSGSTCDFGTWEWSAKAKE